MNQTTTNLRAFHQKGRARYVAMADKLIELMAAAPVSDGIPQ